MSDEDPTRHINGLKAQITSHEAFADELAALAADLRRSGRAHLADPILACSRAFRITALDLRGQLASAKPFDHLEN